MKDKINNWKPWTMSALRKPIVLWRYLYLKYKVASAAKVRIIVGASRTKFSGWIATEQDNLNILVQRDWERLFSESSVDAMLAEHVWEHLDSVEAIIAAKNCYRYLKHDGYIRVAVPDGNHPSVAYIEQVRPGGSGAGSDDHKILYTHSTLAYIFKSAGFSVELLEYFDDTGNFHFSDWQPEDGFIERSKRFDERNNESPLAYTSIIIDARKPSK